MTFVQSDSAHCMFVYMWLYDDHAAGCLHGFFFSDVCFLRCSNNRRTRHRTQKEYFNLYRLNSSKWGGFHRGEMLCFHLCVSEMFSSAVSLDTDLKKSWLKKENLKNLSLTKHKWLLQSELLFSGESIVKLTEQLFSDNDSKQNSSRIMLLLYWWTTINLCFYLCVRVVRMTGAVFKKKWQWEYFTPRRKITWIWF